MIRDVISRLFGAKPPDARGPTALAMVYRRETRIFVEASDLTRELEAGFWVSNGQVQALDDSASDRALGETVLAALASCRVEVPVPERGAKLEAGLFRAMGVRSRRASMSGTRACIVTREPPEGHLRVEPQRNGGSSGEDRGYLPMPELARELVADSAGAEVGRAVRDALDLATAAS